MSQLLQVATRSGSMPILDGVGSPDYFDQGIPYDLDEGVVRLAVTIAGVIDHYHQGLPFTAVGRLAISTDKPVGRIAPGGAPFEDIAEVIVFGSGAVHHFSAGIPYTVEDQLSVSEFDPEGGFDSGFSSGFEV